MAQRIIGLDIGTYSVKAVEIQSYFRYFELANYHEVPVKPPEDETQTQADQIAKALTLLSLEIGRAGETIISAMPGHQVSTRLIRLPFTDSKRINQVIGFEVDGQVPFNVDEAVFDYQIVGQDKDDSLILVGLVQNTAITAFLKMLQQGGFDPKVLDLEPLAYMNLFGELIGQITETAAIVDIGHERTKVSILNQGRIEFVRTISRAGKAITEVIAKRYNLSYDQAQQGKHVDGLVHTDAMGAASLEHRQISDTIKTALVPLVREIRQTFQGHQRQGFKEVERVYLCGGSSLLRGLDLYLKEELSVEVERLKVSGASFSTMEISEKEEPCLPLALALAMRAAGGVSGERSEFNFRKDSFAFKGDFQVLKGKIIHLAISLVVILLLSLVNAGAQYMMLSDEQAALDEQLALTSREIIGKEIDDYSRAVAIVKGQGGAEYTSPLPESSALDILNEISALIPKEVVVDVHQIDVAPKKTQLKGEVETATEVDIIVNALKSHKCFTDVKPGAIRDAIRKDKKEFTLTIVTTCL